MKWLIYLIPVRFPKRNRKTESKCFKWFESQDEKTLFLSIITIAEIRKGNYRLNRKKKTELETWLFDI